MRTYVPGLPFLVVEMIDPTTLTPTPPALCTPCHSLHPPDGAHMVKSGLLKILDERISKYMEDSENILTYIVRILEILSGNAELATTMAEAGWEAKIDDIQACITEKGYSQMLAWRVSQIKPRLVGSD